MVDIIFMILLIMSHLKGSVRAYMGDWYKVQSLEIKAPYQERGTLHYQNQQNCYAPYYL